MNLFDDNFDGGDAGFDEDDFFSSAQPAASILADPEGLLPPRKSNYLIGHENVEQTLIDLINSGAMPHALIFSGPAGIGKSTMAFRLARYLLKHGTVDPAQDSLFGDAPAAATSLNMESNDPTFSKVTSGGHPDLLTIERPMDAKKGMQKNNLDVDTARKVAPFLRMTASNGGWRVVIVDDADSMNRNAQNALLKILEEPPKNALLILVCHRLGAMIPTIRSRCRVLNFNPLNAESMAALMQKEVGGHLETEQKDILSAMAGGSIGTAQKIMVSKGLETTQIILEMFKSWPNFNWVDIHHLAEQAGRAGQDDNFTNIENSFLWVIESFIFSKASNNAALPSPLNQDVFVKMAAYHQLPTWLKIFEELKTHFYQMRNSNLDKRQGVLGAFGILAQ